MTSTLMEQRRYCEQQRTDLVHMLSSICNLVVVVAVVVALVVVVV